MRELSFDEITSVNGAVTSGGCIPYPYPIGPGFPINPDPFPVDPFPTPFPIDPYPSPDPWGSEYS